MTTEIRAIVKFNDNIIGIPVKEYIIDCSKEIREFKYIKIDNSVITPNTFQKLLSPSELIEINKKINCERNIVVKIILPKEEYRINWIKASEILETFCSWITFLTLLPVKIVQWLDESSVQGNTISVGKAFLIHEDSKTQANIITTNQEMFPRDFTLNEWILSTIPNGIIYPLKCFRNALMTNRIEEKIINLVSAMEGISNLMDLEQFQVENCPHCGREIQRSTIVSKDGILTFLKSELHLSRNKIYDPIWKIRSKFIHSDVQNLNCNYEQLVIVEQAAEALFISYMSFYLLKYTDVPFKNKEQILNSNYEFYHPYFGQMLHLRDYLEILKNTKIK